MRRRLGWRVVWISGITALAASKPALAANIILNPSFEAPTDNSGQDTDTTATGWTLYGSCVRADYQSQSGKWSILQETSAPAGGIEQIVSNIDYGTPVILYCGYYFEPDEPNVPGLVSDLALTFLNSSNLPVGSVDANGYSDATYIPSSSVTTTGQWVQYSVSGIAPHGSTQLKVSFDFSGGSPISGAQRAFVDDADLEPGEPAPTAQWTNSGSGDWNQTGNWTSGIIPNGIDVEADFYANPGITSNSTVYTNTPITLGLLQFNNPNECEIAGTGRLTLQEDPALGDAMVNVNQGTDIFDLPATVASDIVFNVNSGANLVIGNPLTIDSGATLSQTGSGSVTYLSTVSIQSGGAIAFTSSTHAAQLNVAANATASLISGVRGIVVSIDNLSNSGTLDVGDSEVILTYGSGPDPIASIAAEIVSGYNGGAWNGKGIISSSAATHSGYALGYADSADPGNPAGLPSGTIEIKYTLEGDVNLDGVVNDIDFGIFAADFGKTVSRWDQGDFNYDDVVNGLDFVPLAANFDLGTSGPSALSDPALVAFAEANGLMVDVPEPMPIVVFGAAAVAILTRRRPKRRLESQLK